METFPHTHEARILQVYKENPYQCMVGDLYSKFGPFEYTQTSTVGDGDGSGVDISHVC